MSRIGQKRTVSMPPVFQLQPSNSHRSLIATDPPAWQRQSQGLNKDSLVEGWQPLAFTLESFGKDDVAVPDIATISFPGALALRSNRVSDVFPDCGGLEFLPIKVDGNPWFLVNVLTPQAEIDETKSSVLRALGGEIFMVLELTIASNSAQVVAELFTLKNSNRAQLFALESFRNRLDRTGMKGITFRAIAPT